MNLIKNLFNCSKHYTKIQQQLSGRRGTPCRADGMQYYRRPLITGWWPASIFKEEPSLVDGSWILHSIYSVKFKFQRCASAKCTSPNSTGCRTSNHCKPTLLDARVKTQHKARPALCTWPQGYARQRTY